MTELALFGEDRPAPGPPPVVQRSAEISDDGLYRYELRRAWGPSLRTMTFVMLNPSVADALRDDQTIRRCLHYARREGCGRLLVVNLYALRSTDPKALLTHPDPVGPLNDETLARVLADTLDHATLKPLPVVAAWGGKAGPDRVARFLELARGRPLLCLGETKDGAPRHPSRLGNEQPLTRWG